MLRYQLHWRFLQVLAPESCSVRGMFGDCLFLNVMSYTINFLNRINLVINTKYIHQQLKHQIFTVQHQQVVVVYMCYSVYSVMLNVSNLASLCITTVQNIVRCRIYVFSCRK